ncbi:IQ calmodulin-binding motif protein [Penicillium chermesinum]|uniref:IQ calmodulin-binding motif protein n=1 Tax=Penicillium chermesinum TaxID=63820 RepID=A0A9W9TJV7_9EURO|nr:IQ calmodulin-binding motif protein [Penicillium chermesinum]KAJ5223910.1 IQ calmodulin-binding motif protein [Penicillium chermesinum]
MPVQTTTSCSESSPTTEKMGPSVNDVTDDPEYAARTIQRVFRGYRTRRELRGLNLAASARRSIESERAHDDDKETSAAQKNWQRAVSVAIQAGRNDEDAASETVPKTNCQPSAHQANRKPTAAKMMDLQYFLEMVDTKHRHGSNLRAYHSIWKRSPSNQNFFYWLDYGDGVNAEAPNCSREQLEKDQVRYLSPEERLNYMVTVDEKGLFRWVKNGELVETNNKKYRDSLQGVVHIDDSAPRFQGNSISIDTTTEGATLGQTLSSSSSMSSDSSSSSSAQSLAPSQTMQSQKSDTGSGKNISTQEDYELNKAVDKFARIRPAALYDHFAAKLSKKEDMWIFVADTQFRIYIGIKEPGGFQHSSFLRGGRIAAAGMLKIRHGQLRSLAPLSGHYRPHVANFRAFHRSLKERGVDLSRVSMSKSYATLAGIEGYVAAKRKVRSVQEKIDDAKQKLQPGAQQDKS